MNNLIISLGIIDVHSIPEYRSKVPGKLTGLIGMEIEFGLRFDQV